MIKIFRMSASKRYLALLPTNLRISAFERYFVHSPTFVCRQTSDILLQRDLAVKAKYRCRPDILPTIFFHREVLVELHQSAFEMWLEMEFSFDSAKTRVSSCFLALVDRDGGSQTVRRFPLLCIRWRRPP